MPSSQTSESRQKYYYPGVGEKSSQTTRCAKSRATEGDGLRGLAGEFQGLLHDSKASLAKVKAAPPAPPRVSRSTLLPALEQLDSRFSQAGMAMKQGDRRALLQSLVAARYARPNSPPVSPGQRGGWNVPRTWPVRRSSQALMVCSRQPRPCRGLVCPERRLSSPVGWRRRRDASGSCDR